jgi:hypothetical protein
VTRFRKGTLDHDGNGRRGGSMKGDSEMAKASTKKAAAKPRTAKKGMDPQSGMEAGPDPRDARRKADAMFAEADAKGDAKADPSPEELEALRVQHQVRGF